MARGRGTWSDEFTDADYIARWKGKCVINEQGCWVWQGSLVGNGYPGSSYRGQSCRVHRLSYELHRAQIPEGWDACHTCDNRLCINPLHLFAAPRSVNVQDMRAKRRGNHQKKVTCIHGHPFDEANTYLDSRGFRQCRECNRIRLRRPEYRQRANERQKLRREQNRIQLGKEQTL